MTEDRNRVEIAYARPDAQTILSVTASEGLTAKGAIEQSGILQRFPEIDLRVNRVGVFGKLAKLDQALAPGDRVEIYRPLIADPKVVRKQRAAQGKAIRKRNDGKAQA
ncbi:RnfH family protein [Candidatus Thiosymbion oneisti]|uniref:RnfH family protein n=1 Tax=Candidatus Thiosymbion oneisti TaxID=589554 RepID=UPI000A6A2E53|nr:RnfH family protein [Candidatus Thiosymbion oneisti]